MAELRYGLVSTKYDMAESEPKFEYVLDGVQISIEASDLTIEQAREMMLRAYPERKLDIYRGLRRATEPYLPTEAA